MSARAELYVAYLSKEGFTPRVDSDGDVAFKFEGGNYYIKIDDDEGYFQVVFPNFWEIEGGAELARVLYAANAATRATKVAKIYVRPDGLNTSASIEIFLPRPEDFTVVFRRSLAAIGHALKKFRTAMEEFGEK